MDTLLPLVSIPLCLVLVPIIGRLAVKKGWVAQPSAERWHRKPTALMGGIGIYLALACPLLLLGNFSALCARFTASDHGAPPPSIAATLWVGMTLMFLLGLLDDFIRIKPHTKLVGQILVASLTTFLGFRLHWLTSMTLDTTLSIFWIIGITNAFNLIDNMDGLCAGVGLIAAVYLAGLFWGVAPPDALAALALAGTLAAFLVYNFHPASIFMGDSGSLVIGYGMALLCLHYAQSVSENFIAAVAVPILLLMVPILDTTLVTMIRLLSGRKASMGGRDHTSHRLVLMGLSERGAVLFLYLTGAVSGVAALFVSRSDGLTSPAVIIPVLLAMGLMGLYLAQLRVYPEREFCLLRNRAYTPVLMELTYKKQLLLVLLDFGLVAFSYYLAYRLRFDGAAFAAFFRGFLQSLPAIIACKLLVFFTVGVYRGIWGHMSTNDVFVYLKASTMATLLSVVLVTFIYRFAGFSKGVFVIDWLLTTGLLLGTRGSFRIFQDILKRKSMNGPGVFIYGAGRGGEILLREMLNNRRLGMTPLGFIDDDPLKTGKKLLGYPVLGGFDDLARLAEKHSPQGILISFNHTGRRTLAGIATACRQHGMFVRRFTIHLTEVDDAP